jgi:two-component system sensor histidine kinase YesM
MYVGNKTNEIIATNKWDGVSLEHFYNDVSRTEWFHTVDAEKGKGVWLNSDDIRLTRSPNLLLYGKRLNNLDTLEPIGILIISIDENVFEEMFRDIRKPQNGNFVILAQNKIVYDSQTVDISSIPQRDMAMLYNLPEKGTRIEMIKGEKYIVTFDTNPGTEWKVVSMIPYSSVNGEIVFIRNLTITLSALTFLLAAYGSFLISNKITKQLSLLTTIARKVAKRDEIDGILFKENDEIGKIGNQFLRIFRTNTELTDKLYEAKLKEKEAELHALQSHINPHFLYNTLNSIFLMAEKIGAKNISKMVMSLSNIFKLSLNNGQYITTVANEMEQIRNYLEIQNIRYRDKFEVAIEMDPGILNERMLKLLIQPIVENAIYHGMELKEEKGFISISGRREGKALVFEVKDDGVGFDPETAKAGGYALQNIRERIALQYGSEYAMHVESKPGAGTKVTLVIGIME